MTGAPEDDERQGRGADPGRDSAPRRTYLAAITMVMLVAEI